MVKHKTINDAYVRQHARPGEEWAEARRRVEGEAYARLYQIPDCPECAEASYSMAIAQEEHAKGRCLTSLEPTEEWPAEALSANLLAAHYEHRQRHVDAQKIIARKHIEGVLQRIDAQTAPIHAMKCAIHARGFLDACDAVGVFETWEIGELRLAVVLREEQAMLAFVSQVRDGDPNALPWVNLENEARRN